MGPGQARAAVGTDGLVWKRSSPALPSPRTLAVPAPSPELRPSPALFKAALGLCPNLCFPETAPLWGGCCACQCGTEGGTCHRASAQQQPPAAFQRAHQAEPQGIAAGRPGGTRAFRGPLGPPFSSKRWVQRALGSILSRRAGVCVCVCSACATRPVYLPRGARALPAPLGSFLPRQWDAGVTSAQPS